MTFAQGNGPMVGSSCSLQSHGTQVSIFCRFQEVRFDHVKKTERKAIQFGQTIGSVTDWFPVLMFRLLCRRQHHAVL